MPFHTTIPLDWGRKSEDEFSVNHEKNPINIVAEHWHDCFELICMLDGVRDFSVGETVFRLEAGDLLVVPPHVPHASPGGGPYDCLVFGYAESVIYTTDNSYSSLKYLLPFRLHQPAGNCLFRRGTAKLDDLRALILRGEEIFTGSSLTRSLDMRACILQVHAILYRLFLSRGSRSTDSDQTFRYMVEAQEYINAHLSETISPYDIADALHISHSHLCRLFAAVFGMPPGALVNQYRLGLAEQLLIEHPEMSITEIGLRAGFGDSSYFIRRFRALKGMSPGEFRARLRMK